MCELKVAITARELAGFHANMNNAILYAMAHPDCAKSAPGIYENGQGQLVYVDIYGDSGPAPSVDSLNGWTV